MSRREPARDLNVGKAGGLEVREIHRLSPPLRHCLLPRVNARAGGSKQCAVDVPEQDGGHARCRSGCTTAATCCARLAESSSWATSASEF